MVKITNGTNVFEVTAGAFEGIYSKQGYRKMAAEQPAVAKVPIPAAKTEEELFVEMIMEKPVSQWNKDEVKRFAELTGLDITGTKNVGEAKDVIKEFLAEAGE